MPNSLKARINDDMKTALRAGDRPRLGTIRLMLAAINQREIDTRTELNDAEVVAILDKMVKQRRESIAQYQSARRGDLVAAEQFELDLILSYMPAALSDEEVARLIDASLTESDASSLRDMGKVMRLIKPQLQGRADMAAVSARVKTRLSGR
ncbi:MAG TPA: GatB/YqeY domain-containing protein [Gammaproteobacteria bacterium]|nr:GatB/YqeY domain-containing protein [Gammaproteobacteria bacterium]